MQDHQFGRNFGRHLHFVLPHVPERLQNHEVRGFVVARLLFLVRDRDRNLGGLLVEVQNPVNLR